MKNQPHCMLACGAMLCLVACTAHPATAPRLRDRGAYRARADLLEPGSSGARAVVRERGDDCRELVVANGHDRVAQPLGAVALERHCEAHLDTQPRHHADVVAADLTAAPGDELIVASLADAGHDAASGTLDLVIGDVVMRLLDTLDPSALALGDFNGDGRVDLAVAKLWQPNETTREQHVTDIERRDLNGQLAVYYSIAHEGHVELDARDRAEVFAPIAGVVQLRAADVNQDGQLDLIAAGPELSVVFGPISGDPAILRLPFHHPEQRLTALAVDYTHMLGPQGETDTVIAATESIFSANEGHLRRWFGVGVWRLRKDGDTLRVVADRFLPTPERMPSAVRFVDLDGDAYPDLIAGFQSAALDLGRLGAEPCVWLAAAQERMGSEPWPLHIEVGGRRRYPATSSVLAYASDGDALLDAGRDATRIITYRGRGHLVGAVVSRGGERVPARFVPGDRFVTLIDGALPSAPVDVTWRVAERPHLVLTSTSPADDETAGTLWLDFPERERVSTAKE